MVTRKCRSTSILRHRIISPENFKKRYIYQIPPPPSSFSNERWWRTSPLGCNLNLEPALPCRLDASCFRISFLTRTKLWPPMSHAFRHLKRYKCLSYNVWNPHAKILLISHLFFFVVSCKATFAQELLKHSSANSLCAAESDKEQQRRANIIIDMNVTNLWVKKGQRP